MNTFLDILIGSIIGSLLLLDIFAMNNSLVESEHQGTQYYAVQKNGYELQEQLTRDLRLAGLYVPTGAPVFLQADSTHLQFRADIDYDGTANIITYSLGSASAATETPNPNDRYLHRQIDGNPEEISSYGIITLRFSYFDKDGAPAGTLTAIRQVGYSYYAESTYEYDNFYPGMHFSGRIMPNNLD